jgi:hypothetical protein
MITDYTSNDILLGNGKKYKIHDGNHWYRELICAQQPSYDISEKLSKMKTQGTQCVSFVHRSFIQISIPIQVLSHCYSFIHLPSPFLTYIA